MILLHERAERILAAEVFASVTDPTFRKLLSTGCWADIVAAAPLKAIKIALSMKPIPINWAYWILRSRSECLTAKRIRQLVDIVALDARRSHETFRDCYTSLTPSQHQQLVTTIATSPYRSRYALYDSSHLLTVQQRQQLIETIATNRSQSCWTLYDCWGVLTVAQIQQLINVVATGASEVYSTLRGCYDRLNEAQRQQLINAITTSKWAGVFLLDCFKLLTVAQVQQLVNVVATDAKVAMDTLAGCYTRLTPDQRQQLKNTWLRHRSDN